MGNFLSGEFARLGYFSVACFADGSIEFSAIRASTLFRHGEGRHAS
jgi:hypothetical protein